MDKRLTVKRNGNVIMESDALVMITGYVLDEDIFKLKIKSTNHGRMTIYPYGGLHRIAIRGQVL